MNYDILHIPGPPVGGCGQAYVEHRLRDDHDAGDRVTIKCKRCGRVGEHEILARLTGLERAQA